MNQRRKKNSKSPHNFQERLSKRPTHRRCNFDEINLKNALLRELPLEFFFEPGSNPDEISLQSWDPSLEALCFDYAGEGDVELLKKQIKSFVLSRAKKELNYG